MASATVRATSVTPQAPQQSNILVLERRGPVWKVVSLKVDDGSYKPKVVEEPAPVPLQMVMPSASGAVAPPSGSVKVTLPPSGSAKVTIPARPAPPPPAPPPAPPAPAKP